MNAHTIQTNDATEYTCDQCKAIGGSIDSGEHWHYHYINAEGETLFLCETCGDEWMSPARAMVCAEYCKAHHEECGGHCFDDDWIAEYLEEMEKEE